VHGVIHGKSWSGKIDLGSHADAHSRTSGIVRGWLWSIARHEAIDRLRRACGRGRRSE
jgi:DNA-directed RNA polymerase specialized sigma24 family protein